MIEDSLIEVALEETRDKMQRGVEHTKMEFGTVRTGRAAPALVEKLKVDYFGSEVILQQLAGVTVPEPRVLVIHPYDKGAVKAIEKAIQISDLGVNPSTDGETLRLVFPQVSEERRKELIKVVRRHAEEGKVSIRNIRHAARHDLEALAHEGEISSDDLERAKKEIEHLTNGFVTEIDRLVAHKEQELLEV
jgi:ribosome recycling factor